jgi:glycosyltransferase involved in cell wall biosynthesis
VVQIRPVNKAIQQYRRAVSIEGRDVESYSALALAYPSLYEGFGLPVAEALACGTPVLTSNVSSLPEVTGDAAVLVDPDDPDAIAEGMRRLVEDQALRDRLARAGPERASRFTWEDTARKTAGALHAAARS